MYKLGYEINIKQSEPAPSGRIFYEGTDRTDQPVDGSPSKNKTHNSNHGDQNTITKKRGTDSETNRVSCFVFVLLPVFLLTGIILWLGGQILFQDEIIRQIGSVELKNTTPGFLFFFGVIVYCLYRQLSAN